MAIFYKITHEEAHFDLVPQGADHDALLPILKKALSKDIDQRYQTAAEFALDLRGWLKAHATTPSSQNVLQSLVDLEAPTTPPLAVTNAAGAAFTGEAEDATIDGGRRGPALPRRPGTGRTPAKPPADPVAPTLRPAATRVGPPPSPRPQPRPSRPSVLPWIATASPSWRWPRPGGCCGRTSSSRRRPRSCRPHSPAPAATAAPTATPAAEPPPRADAGAGPDARRGGGQGGGADPRRAGRVHGGQLRPRGRRGAAGAARGPVESRRAGGARARARRAEGPSVAARRGGGARARRLRRAAAQVETARQQAPWERARRRPHVQDRSGARFRAAGRGRGREAAARGEGQRAAEPGERRRVAAAVRRGHRALRARPRDRPVERRPRRPARARDRQQGRGRRRRAAGRPRPRVRGRRDAGEGRRGGDGRSRRVRGHGRRHGEEGDPGGGAPRPHPVRARTVGAEGRRALPHRRLPAQRRPAADPAHAGARHHDRGRPPGVGAGAALGDDRRARRPRPRLPDPRQRGVEGRHLELDDGHRAQDADGRQLPSTLAWR